MEGSTITGHSKRWLGFEKNKVWAYTVFSLRDDLNLKQMSYNSTKEEITEYVRNVLKKL